MLKLFDEAHQGKTHSFNFSGIAKGMIYKYAYSNLKLKLKRVTKVRFQTSTPLFGNTNYINVIILLQ